jgi:hypothetical protein
MVSVTNTESFESDSVGATQATISGWSPNASTRSFLIFHCMDGSPSLPIEGAQVCTIGGTEIPLLTQCTQNSGNGEGRNASVFYSENLALSGDVVISDGTSVGQFMSIMETDGFMASYGLRWMNEANPVGTLTHPSNSTDWLSVFNFCINLASTAVTTSTVTVHEATTDAVQTGTFYGALASRASTGVLDACDYFNCSSNQQHAYFAALFADTKRGFDGKEIDSTGGFEILDTLNNDAAFNAIFSRP